MPRTELEYLRKEVEKLKRNPLGDAQASVSLLELLDKLNANITRLNAIFEGANDEMVKAFNESAMQEQLRKMLDQQEKLARGIVAVGELVKQLEQKVNAPLPSLEQFAPLTPTRAPPQVDESAINAELQAAPVSSSVQRNPFSADGGPEYQPILSVPLPRPGGGMMTPPTARPTMPPGFIPDSDIPPPPPRRF